MRAIAFILLLYAAVAITNQYSILTSTIDFNLIYIWPQIVALIIGYLIMNSQRRKTIYIDELQWCIPVAKVSIALSFMILLVTLPVPGRDAKLEVISSNNLLYYINLINSGILMVLLCSLMQPIKVALSKKTFIYILCALVFFSMTNLSRTMVFYFAIAMFLSKVKLTITKRQLFLLFGGLILFMGLMPILQGRTDNVEGAIGRSILNIIFYLSYSFGLGDYLINNMNVEGISTGYFGYALSKMVGEPLSSNIFFDNKMLYDFVSLGVSDIYGSLNANVMYPLWSTVYIDFGVYSFIPYLITLLLMIILLYARLLLLFSWFLFRFFALGFLISPVLLRDVVIELIVVVVFQILIVMKKLRREIA
ncbi:hypothetical protein ACQ7NX_02220 [Enterobacter cloacae subsp. dissolvens]|uniref:hypothetical protein n=1 Tax=Enterobacter cloacae TaxID=550 RepID=UPI0007B38571|nr:hypothetical protein [Enterobacter cloacae]KZP67940.1 hypothetical protein A3N40_17790 [Enterobacter cloacae subsp. dissolvens]